MHSSDSPIIYHYEYKLYVYCGILASNYSEMEKRSKIGWKKKGGKVEKMNKSTVKWKTRLKNDNFRN